VAELHLVPAPITQHFVASCPTVPLWSKKSGSCPFEVHPGHSIGQARGLGFVGLEVI
jgi:hypothetical protein